MAHRRRTLAGVAMLTILVIGVAALLTRDQWDWLLEDGSVQSEGVTAPTIDDVNTAVERLYRIGDQSSARYVVQERLVGRSKTTVGTTPAVAGDIAVNTADPSASRVGTIVVNVEMFESDNGLRDRRIRHDFLESTHYPFAEFTVTSVDGWPTTLADDQTYDLSLTGDLTVKETTASATFTGTVTITPQTLTATMRTTVLMSTYDVGPINIAGLANTADEVDIEFDLAAARVELASAPEPPPDFVAPDRAPPAGAFADTVMPILTGHCASCHNEGGPGWSTIALDTAGDAAAIADGIALVTGAGYMPPWPASDVGLEFQHDWSLSADEVETISTWSEAGGGLDVDPDTPLVAETALLRPIDRDVVAAGEPYTGSLEVPDDYRCQVYEVGDPSEARWIRALSFEPDRADVVHHALTFTVPSNRRAAVERLAATDDAPGWECFGFPGMGASQVAGWAPGTPPTVLPEGAAILLEPGDFVVAQIHYHYDHDTPPDSSTLVFDLAADEEVASAGGALQPIGYATYLAPAEIPCTPDDVGPLCDRNAVIAELRDEYGAFSATIPGGLLFLCGQSLTELLADTDGVASAHCDHEVANPGVIVNLWPHMHQFGASIRMTLNPETPEELVLVDVPVWSFEWQLDYQPVEDVVIGPGDTIRVECTWDRSLFHQPEPRYITWNFGTFDEMCYSTMATAPVE